jgi:hypothetical protein
VNEFAAAISPTECPESGMGDVLMFRPRSPSESEANAINVGAVEIIFFPGVRYERMVEPEEAAPAPRRAGKPPAGGTRARRKKQPA